MQTRKPANTQARKAATPKGSAIIIPYHSFTIPKLSFELREAGMHMNMSCYSIFPGYNMLYIYKPLCIFFIMYTVMI